MAAMVAMMLRTTAAMYGRAVRVRTGARLVWRRADARLVLRRAGRVFTDARARASCWGDALDARVMLVRAGREVKGARVMSGACAYSYVLVSRAGGGGQRCPPARENGTLSCCARRDGGDQ